MDNETSGKANILIIDDEPALRESIAMVLENAGYRASCAESGPQALGIMKDHFFDILLVDYMLPEMNGIECIKQGLAISPESIPVVITGSSSIEIAVEAMRIGAHDYLLKPLNLDDLIELLSSILQEREECRKGKQNLEQVLKQIGNEQEERMTSVVLSADHATIQKRKVSILAPVKQIFTDIAVLMRLSKK